MSQSDLKPSVEHSNHKASIPGSGSGMDRVVEKQKWPPRRIALIGGVTLFILLVAYGIWSQGGGTKLRVEQDKLTISTIDRGAFQEYIPVIGSVEPLRTVFLDAAEGGRVDEIYVEEGATLAAGDPIVKLTNNDLLLDLLNREAQFYETMNFLRTARLSMEQNTLNLRQQIVEINYQIIRLERQHARNEELYEKALISEDDYHQVKDELDYQQQRRSLTLASHRQDSLMRLVQVNSLEASVTQIERNLDVVRGNLENLVVKAPIAGQLTSFDVEIGESIGVGRRLGQIDKLDGFRVNVPIDEHYLSRINSGQMGSFTFASEKYNLEIKKVYPEVQNGRFQVDMEFVDNGPSGIRRGQTLRIGLELGDLTDVVLIPRGGFFQTTGGNWVFVAQGNEAVKRQIQLGRQNPQYFEVLEGLEVGERVITSSYDTFGDVDRLILQE
ncbi:MAG: efflux RND transporter periplasmic adaptor subunit [Rhodothermales bacterium]